jgi:two-component system nitrate/nitrite response regulator NarL
MLDESGTEPAKAVQSLTPREREVLDLIAGGLTNLEIAARLHVSVHGVKFHLAAIYRRLGVSNRTEAAIMYLRALGDGTDPLGRPGAVD